MTNTSPSRSRSVESLVQGVQTSDGAGVKLTRVLTQSLQKRLDPFLMLDAFRNDKPEDYMGGFPNHPHRGFETITYMIAGRMRHRDSAGNEGLLEPGGVQWMTAGSGLIHSELPEQADGLMEGFQLWLNLPAKNKMIKPSYRDITPSHIPEYTTPEGVMVRVIAGESAQTKGAVQRPDTEPLILDIHLPANSEFEVEVAPGHHAFVYTYRGEGIIGEQTVPDRHMAILNDDGAPCVRLRSTVQTKCLLVAGKPLLEPIAQHGPFVMNSEQEIQQTLQDYRAGHFEAAVVQAL